WHDRLRLGRKGRLPAARPQGATASSQQERQSQPQRWSPLSRATAIRKGQPPPTQGNGGTKGARGLGHTFEKRKILPL
ncbi:hypothetical protein B296_00055144, partial [Ensete ventricosum]